MPQPRTDQLTQRQSHDVEPYQKVFGPGKRRLRGLWKRGDRFYGRLTVEDPQTGLRAVKRVSLEDADGNPVRTVAAAVRALASLTSKRDERTLALLPKRSPTFQEYADKYLAWLEAVPDAKAAKTVQNERGFLKQWSRHFGHLRLTEIQESTMTEYQRRRSQEGLAAISINHELVVVRNVLRAAVTEKILRSVPKVARLRVITTRKSLLSPAELDTICNVAIRDCRNGQEFADWVRVMAYSGGRRQETLALQWQDVAFDRGQLHFGARGGTKSRKPRSVDFNPDLETHLKDMATRRQPDSKFLFPSPRRGDLDCAAVSLQPTLHMVRKTAGLPHFSAHLCRHYFASRCVMAGIDFMTIAAWLGHADGGVLVGKVYGHLADEHRKLMAQRLLFEPQIAESEKEGQR